MKDEDLFVKDGPPSTHSDQAPGGDSDRRSLSPTHSLPKEALVWTHHPIRRRLVVMMVVVLVVLVGGYGVFRVLSPASRQASSAFQQARCPFSPGAGLVEGRNLTCGFVTVSEDHSQPQGPTIRLSVAVFKTASSHPDPDPILFLSGGPGQAYLEEAGSAVTAANLPPNRDLILFDQRGVGSSQPSLSCTDAIGLQDCHTRIVQSGINLNDFTTQQDAADVPDLIRALGYQQVNLDSVSYGTRLALTVMRLYPTDLRSVILNSVLPPQVNLFTSIPQATARALNVLFSGCAADSFCNKTYPHLQTVFYHLIDDLNAAPITFQTTDQAGNSVSETINGNNLVLVVRNALYSTALIPELPSMIFHIRQHDYTQLASIYRYSGETIGTAGVFYSVMCGEDMAYTTQHDLEASVQGLAPAIQSALLNFGLGRYAVCQFWGMKPVPKVQKEPVSSSVPTLILQGEYDPVTPPTNGMLAAQTLSRSYFFLFPGVGHGVASPTGCPQAIKRAFLENPTERPNASCISRMQEPVFT